jgi:hypothetical protein
MTIARRELLKGLSGMAACVALGKVGELDRLLAALA